MKTTMKLLRSIAPFALLSILTFCTSPKPNAISDRQLITELFTTWKQSDIEMTKNHPIIKRVKLTNDSIAEFDINTSVGQITLTGKWKFKFDSSNGLDIVLKSDANVKQLQTDIHPYNLLITYGNQGEKLIKLPVVFVN